MSKVENIVKEYSKKIILSMKDVCVNAYIAGTKRAAKTKAEFKAIGEEALEYFNEQTGWIETHFETYDLDVITEKLNTAIAQGQNFPQFWQSMRDSGLFSRARAEKIFRTETNRAYSEGTIRQYLKENVKQVNILLGPNPCPICSDIAMAGPYNTKDVEGLFPTHPNCSCVIVNAEVSNPGGR
jgi:hypothetical protein